MGWPVHRVHRPALGIHSFGAIMFKWSPLELPDESPQCPTSLPVLIVTREPRLTITTADNRADVSPVASRFSYPNLRVADPAPAAVRGWRRRAVRSAGLRRRRYCWCS